MSEQPTTGQVGDQLAKLSKSDPRFRAALLANPRAALESVGAKFPSEVTVKVVEETPTEMYVVVPFVTKGGELSEEALEAVAGGHADLSNLSIQKVLDKTSPLTTSSSPLSFSSSSLTKI